VVHLNFTAQLAQTFHGLATKLNYSSVSGSCLFALVSFFSHFFFILVSIALTLLTKWSQFTGANAKKIGCKKKG
jgi:hypothetical protein